MQKASLQQGSLCFFYKFALKSYYSHEMYRFIISLLHKEITYEE